MVNLESRKAMLCKPETMRPVGDAVTGSLRRHWPRSIIYAYETSEVHHRASLASAGIVKRGRLTVIVNKSGMGP